MSIKKAKLSAIVIDGDTTTLEVLAALLTKAGIEARTYAGVEAALAAKDQVYPADLIVTDLSKPFSPELLVALCHRARRERGLPHSEDLLEARTRELRESEAYYRALFESVSDAVLVHDIGFDGMPGTFIAANRIALERLGYSREDLLRLTPRDIAPESEFDELAAARASIASTGTAMFETVHLSRDGRRIPVESHVSILKLGERRVAVSVARDLSECRRVEEALKASEARNRALLAAVPDMMFVLDREGRFLDCHAPDPHRFFVPRESFLNKHVAEVLPGEMAAITVGKLQALFQGGQAQVYEYQLDIGGEARSFEARMVIASENSALSIVRDITEQRRAREGERRHQADRDLIGRLALAAIKTDDLLRFQEEMLPQLGQALDVSRVYVFTYRHDRKTMDNTAEWTAPGVSAQQNNLQDIDADTGWWWIATLMRGEAIDFADITKIPDERTVTDLRSQDIRSVLVMPLFIGTRYCGFIGLDECRQRREWTVRDRTLLAEAARILIGVWAGEDLRQSEERFRGILQNVATVAVQGYAIDGTVRYWNHASETFYGYSATQAVGQNILDLIIPPQMRDEVRVAIGRMAETGESIPASELQLMRRDGSVIPVYSSHALVRVPQRDPELFCIDIDLTDRKQAEEERERLQGQLTQAQKMESVGRLAGGVAHDFNNMLAVILGYVELAMEQVGEEGSLHDSLEQVKIAAQRSADLIRQLLAFARKQTVTPKVLDCNETVEGMLKLLRRLIGEDIDLTWRPGRDLWPVLMDQSQFDQILANLCVNARDAIAGVGKIAIETCNVVFDEECTALHPEAVPGDYVQLAVSDDGCGIAPEALSSIFEPFYTTKEVGRGTGLGLASVYGAVRQNNGFITVASEPGRGTTFRLYLPRHPDEAAESEQGQPGRLTPGSETILLVEDETMILLLTTKMLEQLGYTVLAAATPGEAMRLAREHSGSIDLLLTDVIMPEMNGRDLARNLLSLYPMMKRLFMSGYPASVIAHHGLLDQGIHFIHKPFSRKDLGEKIREVLD
jgi:PAS domain S-box-containing protein